ncbi:hypothetical protein JCM11641_002076 [Rhodosporidiobolus odoratus]
MSHELAVEGDKVLEKDERGKDYTRVHSGYVAASHNKRFSQETRDNAAHLAADLEAAHHPDSHPKPAASSQSHSHSKKEEHHDVGGHDLRHSSSEEQGDHSSPSKNDGRSAHEHHVIGGYKATLHRADRSEEAKEHAREKLEEMGVDPDTV